MKVAYIRGSTEKQHPENQEDEIRRYAVIVPGFETPDYIL